MKMMGHVEQYLIDVKLRNMARMGKHQMFLCSKLGILGTYLMAPHDIQNSKISKVNRIFLVSSMY